MNLKTFRAKSMAQALQLVKQTYGSTGVILHTRSYKQGGVLGIGAQNIVEVTATDGRYIGRQRRQLARQTQQSIRRLEQPRLTPTGSRRTATSPTPVVEPVNQAAGDLIKRTYAAARAELERTQIAAAPAQLNSMATASATDPTAHAPAATAVLAPPPPADQHQLTQEMKAVKSMVSHMMRRQDAQQQQEPKVPQKLFEQYLGLLEQDVAQELAQQIVQQVHAQLETDKLDDAEACRQAVADAIASLIPTDDNAKPITRGPDGRPCTIALVGPTGVGKTTTIAKLAATFKLKHKITVGLITIDSYRIAAVDQLRTYAGIIGVQLQVVLSPDEMSDAIAACAHCDVVLIDTAGRAPREESKLHDLAQFLDVAKPHQVHLVLASTCTEAVMLDAIERFARIKTDRIIFTKLDEAVSFGVLLNVSQKVNKQLSYITTGQEVPHQIEPGQSTRLAQLVMGEGMVKP